MHIVKETAISSGDNLRACWHTCAMKKILDAIESYNYVVWDWNGTLLNDMEMSLASIGEQLQEHHLPVPSVAEYRKIFTFPVVDYYVRLGFDFSKESFDSLADKFMKAYYANLSRADLFPEVREMLSEVDRLGKKQSILSAYPQEQLLKIVDHFDISHHFCNIYGLGDHYARSKIERGMELIEDSKMVLQETVLIGDTDHDLEVGREMGIDVILIADGHQSYERLKKLDTMVIPTRY